MIWNTNQNTCVQIFKTHVALIPHIQKHIKQWNSLQVKKKPKHVALVIQHLQKIKHTFPHIVPTLRISSSLLSFFSMVLWAVIFLHSYILVPAASSIIARIWNKIIWQNVNDFYHVKLVQLKACLAYYLSITLPYPEKKEKRNARFSHLCRLHI